MTDGPTSIADDDGSERLGGPEPPADGAGPDGLDGASDRAGQHASADVAPELFGW
ncbi:hypothetical protein ACFQMF_08625 [Halorubrum rutilum]|uniref:Uncharacterized protein n=1 Tax=Halorubrum rutilum TaxID=1364933 RepID=A0ABD6AKY6_9EURY|nr:hypothetical protein [Halorubrum rutilum]